MNQTIQINQSIVQTNKILTFFEDLKSPINIITFQPYSGAWSEEEKQFAFTQYLIIWIPITQAPQSIIKPHLMAPNKGGIKLS